MNYTELINFLVTFAFSFLIGLEVKTYNESFKQENPLIGSTRTYTFLGIIGFLFYKINIWIYLAGFLGFSAMFLVFYIQRVIHHKSSILMYLIGAIVYSIGPLTQTHNIWMPALVFVLVVFILNSKYKIKKILTKIDTQEIETLSKFILLSIVILPLLPKKPLPFIDISPFKIWMAVVIISAISYFSYILNKYIFKEKGFLISGILGGLYSSTATTVVLAKKLTPSLKEIINASIIIATAMMYLRLIAIAFIFNPQIGKKLLVPYLVFALIGVGVALFYYKKEKISIQHINDQNPLELQTAFIFAALFVIMMALTKFVTLHFGSTGLKVLSFITGFTDIDPFILSLLMGKYHISQNEIVSAIFIATGSNNFLKAFYAYFFGKKYALISFFWLILFGIATIALGLSIFKV